MAELSGWDVEKTENIPTQAKSNITNLPATLFITEPLGTIASLSTNLNTIWLKKIGKLKESSIKTG